MITMKKLEPQLGKTRPKNSVLAAFEEFQFAWYAQIHLGCPLFPLSAAAPRKSTVSYLRFSPPPGLPGALPSVGK